VYDLRSVDIFGYHKNTLIGGEMKISHLVLFSVIFILFSYTWLTFLLHATLNMDFLLLSSLHTTQKGFH
jgi:hypothetical protein